MRDDEIQLGHLRHDPVDVVARTARSPAGDGEDEPHAELAARDRQRPGDVVAVADERERPALERAEVLLDGHQVRHRLAGVAVVGQAVDDRHAWSTARARSIFACSNVRAMMPSHMPESTRATSCTGSRVPRPTSSSRRMQPAAAEVRHRDGEADARAQARLLEDHRQRLAGQERIVPAGLLELLLQPLRDVEHVPKLVGGVIGDGDEVFHVAV